MKKTFAIALCVAAAGSLCAQNNDELKQLVEQGNKEFSEYDKMLLKQQIDPASVDANQMGQTLLNGYGLLMKALPLDSVPNAKGKVNPKNSKKIVNTILGHANDFFNVGGSLFNSQHYYPQAYEAFMVYADMPGVAALAKSGEQINESQRATAYFNAGLAAYSGNEVTKSAEAFKKARLNNYEQPEAYIYEIACWQSMMQKDSTLEVQAQRNINEIAKAGFDKFGIAQPVFLNNLVNSMITDNKGAEALALVKGKSKRIRKTRICTDCSASSTTGWRMTQSQKRPTARLPQSPMRIMRPCSTLQRRFSAQEPKSGILSKAIPPRLVNNATTSRSIISKLPKP